MTPDQQQTNLAEMVVALAEASAAAIQTAREDGTLPAIAISPEMTLLLSKGLHHVYLPPSLRPTSAQAFQLAFEAIGGIPRFVLWADHNPRQFYTLYSRLVPSTIPPVEQQKVTQVWPEWLSHRRLAYQEETGTTSPDISGPPEDN